MKILQVAKLCVVWLVACGLIASASTAASSNSNSLAWRQFKKHFGKAYASADEEAKRFAIFLASKEYIERHNAAGSATFQLGLNHMSDWTPEEVAKLTGYKSSANNVRRALNSEEKAFLSTYLDSHEPIPASVDWRSWDGRVTRPKNQGACESGWAFATTGLLEGQQVARNFTDKLIGLSEQQLMDCSEFGYGCGLGSVMTALFDVARIGGIESEADYPYEEARGQCAFNKSKVIMSLKEPVFFPSYNEDALAKMVATYGPVAVGIESTRNLVYYSSGILDDNTCRNASLNHAVLIVGYGVDEDGHKYWLVKNSWGPSFGFDGGYFKCVRGRNMCGIANEPVVAAFH